MRSWIKRLLAGSVGLGLAGPALAQQPLPAPASAPQEKIVSVESIPGTVLPEAVAPATEGLHGGGLHILDGDHGGYTGGGSTNWKKVPPVRVIPRVGNFPIPPKGEGHYSLRDAISGESRKAPPKYGYPPFALMPPSFFDADFRYLEDPSNSRDAFDKLHRIHLGDDVMLSTGGQVWWRHMNETNSRLGGRNNTYDLFRARVFADVWYQDWLRGYVEFISAHSMNHDLAPLPIDVNRADLLNAFVDIKLGGCDTSSTFLRVGRQELLLGSQRLISTLDWANTRRTFQGVRAWHTTEKFDVDLFWVQPVAINPSKFDSVDNNQNFAGAWATYRPEKGHFLDFYYLWLDNTNRVTQQRIERAPFNVHTLGSRYTGDKEGFLWDVEGALQWGERGQADIFAGMFTIGAGKNWKDNSLNPTLWLYYDYASGDRSPNSGGNHTFNQLFPFGHYYMGWGDWVGRQNINDLNAHFFVYPAKWITLWTQYHHFWLDSPRDGLYNVAGNVSRSNLTGRSGSQVGDEVDFIMNLHLGKHSDLQFGYCHLFTGNFIQNTGARGDSASLFYAMYSFRW